MHNKSYRRKKGQSRKGKRRQKGKGSGNARTCHRRRIRMGKGARKGKEAGTHGPVSEDA